ncbi:hypothetical protein AAG570_005928 [Ranatra chinensis]|uniref:Uncharacterized protein n=1 Tax=Ranatra chinensis TaxID=642074 RepID=A0ABD0Y9H6_9HEMI
MLEASPVFAWMQKYTSNRALFLNLLTAFLQPNVRANAGCRHSLKMLLTPCTHPRPPFGSISTPGWLLDESEEHDGTLLERKRESVSDRFAEVRWRVPSGLSNGKKWRNSLWREFIAKLFIDKNIVWVPIDSEGGKIVGRMKRGRKHFFVTKNAVGSGLGLDGSNLMEEEPGTGGETKGGREHSVKLCKHARGDVHKTEPLIGNKKSGTMAGIRYSTAVARLMVEPRRPGILIGDGQATSDTNLSKAKVWPTFIGPISHCWLPPQDSLALPAPPGRVPPSRHVGVRI